MKARVHEPMFRWFPHGLRKHVSSACYNRFHLNDRLWTPYRVCTSFHSWFYKRCEPVEWFRTRERGEEKLNRKRRNRTGNRFAFPWRQMAPNQPRLHGWTRFPSIHFSCFLETFTLEDFILNIYIYFVRERKYISMVLVEGTCREMYVMFSAYRSSIKLTDYFIPGGWNDSACNVG